VQRAVEVAIMKIAGRVWKFAQDDINTGLIRKQMYNHLPPHEQGRHCLESLDPEFGSKAQPGDIIVAGKNFGCGSSTPAHYSILALGIPAVVAESFGKLFLSNCVSGGLWPIACAGIADFVETGARLQIDTETAEITNLDTGRTTRGTPLPDLYRDMAAAGGEKAYLKARLAHEPADVSRERATSSTSFRREARIQAPSRESEKPRDG
jgi:3-isopropylmalate dehydratase small subunit